MRTLVEKKKTDFINLGLKHIFPKGVQIFGGGKAYLSAGPSVLRNFNPGRDGTGFCKIPGSRDFSGRD